MGGFLSHFFASRVCLPDISDVSTNTSQKYKMNDLKKSQDPAAEECRVSFSRDLLQQHCFSKKDIEASTMIQAHVQKLTYFLRKAHCTLMCIALGLFTHSCARIIAPEGGPKDTIPPQLIQVFPVQGSTNFKGGTIKLIFDKEIEACDIYKKLIVTPRLQKLDNKPSYTYSVQGKTLKINLKVPLEEETTYTFNFRDAIKDITEGNIAKDLLLTFSTGAQIDVMHVTGQVNYLMTHQPASKAVVALCKADSNNFNIFDNPPDYFIEADEEGKFKLDHIKKGKYYLYASTSKDNQLMIDPSVDEYGFLKDPIELTEKPIEGITLSILKADIRKFQLQSQQFQDQYLELSFNKPVVDYKLSLTHQSKRSQEASTLYSHLIEDKRVIRVYNTLGFLEEDSVKAHLTAQDELGTVIEEIIDIQFKEKRNKKYTTSYKFEPASGTAINSNFVGTVTINKPVKEIVLDRLFFVFNKQSKISIDTEDLQLSDHRDVITIKKQFDPRMLASLEKKEKGHEETIGLVLHIEEEAFITVEEDRNEAMHCMYTLINPKEYGTIRGKIVTETPGFIIQLLDADYKVVKEIRNERNYQFKELIPGNYRLRVLVLKAKDAAWCFGNIYKLKEPDPVIFYPSEVGVIANWEVEGIDFVF